MKAKPRHDGHQGIQTRLKHPFGLLAVALLCAVAVAPLINCKAPCTHDGGIHHYRVVAMRQAFSDGILYTRYLPDLVFGHGLPFFNYRASMSYYLALVPHLLGVPLPVAQNLVYIVSILGSAIAAYLLTRDLFGPRAGLVAAVAYAYAPYQFLDAFTRGNAPESLALPIFPLILWAFRRLALNGRRRWFLVSVGSLVTLYLTHNISSLIFTPLLVAYLGVLWLVYRREGHWLKVAGALVFALSLAAFFLGPALLEKGYVQLEAERGKRNNDFHNNFLTLGEIFAPPAPVDTSLLNAPTRVYLGFVQSILAGIGVVVGLARWRDRERRFTLAFFALVAAVMLGMTTSASVWLWENLPLISFLQFPWRLIGRVALPVAILAGAVFADSPTHKQGSPPASYILPLVSCVLLILTAFPAIYAPLGYCTREPYPTIKDVFAYERKPGGLVGLDPTGAYFPIWMKKKPKGLTLEEQYGTGQTVARFDESALPEGGTILEADYGPNRARIVVEAPVSFQARYLAFYFPGWRVTLDGKPAEIAPTDPEGLISFDVPAGQHTIIIHFGETPLRLFLDIISILSLVVLVFITIRYPQSASGEQQVASGKPRDSSIVHPTVRSASLFIVALLLLLFKLFVVDQTDTTIFRRPGLQADNTLPGIQHPLNQAYADGLLLLGYDQGQATLPADGVLRLDLYLSAYARPSARYVSVVHLVGPDGIRWSDPDSYRPRGYIDYIYTTIWSPGMYAIDSHEIEPLPGAPPGTYDVVLTVFDKDTLAPLSVLNERGQPTAPELTLGQVTLTRPHRLAEPAGRNQLEQELGDLTLLLADFSTDQAAPGDPVFLTTFWQTDEQPTENVTFRLTLVAPDGSPAAEYDLSPTGQWYPTSAWQSGDVWRGQHLFHLPADLDSGEHVWQITLSPTHQSTNLPTTITITAPAHTFTPPTLPHALDVTLGKTATLVGFDLTGEMQPEGTLTITLAWRAEETPTISYRVFVHLLDAEGRLVAQSDGIPAGWTRPTTGWLSGEYITDTHTLTIPVDAAPEEYTLQTGMYVPGGPRLTIGQGSDAIPLITLALAGR